MTFKRGPVWNPADHIGAIVRYYDDGWYHGRLEAFEVTDAGEGIAVIRNFNGSRSRIPEENVRETL